MQHPFITDLSDKSLEDLQTSITDLMKKLNFAYGMQNGPMIHQISMVLESYKAEHSKKMDEIMKKQNIQTNISVEKEAKK
jgi:type II secretory pathway predicted ATPase ExeA